ncbi:MAG: glycogen debranching protein GlgX [Euzebya sp.]
MTQSSDATPRVWPGQPYPLGATFDGVGTHFSLFSENAEAVQLCLFDDDDQQTVIDITEVTGYCWHAYLPDVGPGQRYGYRVHGPYDPATGARFNPAKLLLDPYAKAVTGGIDWDASVFAYDFDDPQQPNDDDSAAHVPRSIVVNPYFDWEGDRLLKIPMHQTVIYEVHVKGFTATHPGVPEELRGTYGGLATEPAITHLRELGVTAVELLPIHQFVHHSHLAERGLRNYWGYDSIAYLAPHHEYAATDRVGGQVQEFKQMVRALHAAGIEVILDVVYNHTGEGNHLGPHLSLRGVDNQSYYRLVEKNPQFYMDYTGTGNSLNARSPFVLQLIMDSLRYWVTEMHVDGFRFDLASTLARELHDVDKLSAFFDIIQQDPVISQVKLIAEPWDVGEGGYQVGNFPPVWSEWNGRYRDTVRDFWRGETATLGEFAQRLTGSSDLYQSDTRRPMASINFVTAHDGFTLADLVSYNDKHNQANGEDNNDGSDHNRSWNHGVEGPTDDPQVLALRARQLRNFLATMLFSQGVPMLVGGDEMGRSQGGNNNAYCQDNEISWFNWTGEDGPGGMDEELLTFTQRLIAFRSAHPVFRRRRWFEGSSIRGSHLDDIGWFRLDGQEMDDRDWEVGHARSLAVFLNGKGIHTPGPQGEPLIDDDMLVIFNAAPDTVTFTVPEPLGKGWRLLLDTAEGGWTQWEDAEEVGEDVPAVGRSLLLLSRAR